MASVFWDAHGIIYIDYLEKGKYINGDYYIELLVRLKDETQKNDRTWRGKKSSFIKTNCFPHPPYSPDLAPSDYWLFADLKKMLQGKRIGSNEEVIAETEAYFEAKDKSFYKHGIEKLGKRWNDCIALEGDYIHE